MHGNRYLRGASAARHDLPTAEDSMPYVTSAGRLEIPIPEEMIARLGRMPRKADRLLCCRVLPNLRRRPPFLFVFAMEEFRH